MIVENQDLDLFNLNRFDCVYRGFSLYEGGTYAIHARRIRGMGVDKSSECMEVNEIEMLDNFKDEITRDRVYNAFRKAWMNGNKSFSIPEYLNLLEND
ncbi:hypothetical protein [Roseofilum sp. Guam]|uniref:hypothetical protein n=1 Tax=Roseofilum sp. Guam TaxID=2821502 RepID=UPI001B2291D2|nr:hypothetical protein [Roseofilum sp. Guam]MBP0028257.1 hypothetical protein [Roseofilum sp. Guam]